MSKISNKPACNNEKEPVNQPIKYPAPHFGISWIGSITTIMMLIILYSKEAKGSMVAITSYMKVFKMIPNINPNIIPSNPFIKSSILISI